MTPSSPPPLRIGILGAARIAAKFSEGVRGSDKVVVCAVASRDRNRAEAFAQTLGIPAVFDTYDAMLSSGEVDAIYNPLPNALHGPWSIRAMDAGKHVLCEKPLADTRAEAVAMFAAAARNGVRLAEAYPYRSQPQTLKLQELVADGAIGTLQMISATFAFTLTARGDIRLDPALGGGALMDLGSYPVSLIRMLSGESPVAMQALGDMDPSGVDRAAMATMSFAGGLLAQASCSFGAAVHRQALIAGTDGVIETSYANHTSNDMPPILLLRRGRERNGIVETVRVAAMNGFRAEADAFADFVAGQPWTGISERESIDVAAILEALRALVKSGA